MHPEPTQSPHFFLFLPFFKKARKEKDDGDYLNKRVSGGGTDTVSFIKVRLKHCVEKTFPLPNIVFHHPHKLAVLLNASETKEKKKSILWSKTSHKKVPTSSLTPDSLPFHHML